jgi:hypothetical protein
MNEEQEGVFTEWFDKNRFVIQNNGKVRDSGNRVVSAKKILDRWNGVQYTVDGWFPVNENIIGEYIEENTPVKEEPPEKEKGQSLSERRQTFRDLFFKFYKIVEGDSFYILSKTINTGKPVPMAIAIADIRGKMADDDIVPPAKEDCSDIVGGLIYTASDILREQKLDVIRYTGPTDFDFKAWTVKVFEYYKIDNTPLNRRMFKHMMHQVKRAGFCLFTNDQDYMYLFYSKVQGIGKSRLIKHVASPFYNGLNDSANLGMLADDNTRRALFADSPAVIDFKEMGLSKNIENFSASLKQFLDLRVFKTREMFAAHTVDTHAFSVWMSSTNLRVEEVIKDTDYRRFYSFDFGLTVEDKVEYTKTGKWKEIDEFFDRTLLDAYRSLNENEEPPEITGERFAQLCEVQASYATRQDTVQLFLNDRNLELFTENVEGTHELSERVLYNYWKVWTKDTGIKQYSLPVLETLIAQSVNARIHTDADGKRCYYAKEKKK